MNDNLPRTLLQYRHDADLRAEWLKQIQEVREIGFRALGRPESLTMGEIQEIAWGFLMASIKLEKMETRPR